MTAAAIERTRDQKLAALKHANQIRTYRANVKQQLHTGSVNVVDVLADPPPELLSMRVWNLLLATPKLGRVKSARLLNQVPHRSVEDRRRDERPAAARTDRDAAVMGLELRPDPKPVRAARKPRRAPDVAEIRRLHAEGLTQAEIAKRLDIVHSTVCRVLQRHGIPARSASSYVRVPTEHEIRALYEDEALGYRAVAVRLGVGSKRLLILMREYGIRRRRNGRPESPDGPSFEIELNRQRPFLARRSRGLCEVASSPECRGRATHAHHRKLRGQGGQNTPENLLHVCIACHGWLHRAKEADPYGNGWIVRSWQDPGEVLVRLRGVSDALERYWPAVAA